MSYPLGLVFFLRDILGPDQEKTLVSMSTCGVTTRREINGKPKWRQFSPILARRFLMTGENGQARYVTLALLHAASLPVEC